MHTHADALQQPSPCSSRPRRDSPFVQTDNMGGGFGECLISWGTHAWAHVPISAQGGGRALCCTVTGGVIECRSLHIPRHLAHLAIPALLSSGRPRQDPPAHGRVRVAGVCWLLLCGWPCDAGTRKACPAHALLHLLKAIEIRVSSSVLECTSQPLFPSVSPSLMQGDEDSCILLPEWAIRAGPRKTVYFDPQEVRQGTSLSLARRGRPVDMGVSCMCTQVYIVALRW